MSNETTSEKLALSKEYIKGIEAVKETLKTKFNIADDVPFAQYPEVISPSEQGALKFYKSAGYVYDPYIPAHENLDISGMSSPDANGTFINQRPDYSGTSRVWKNGNYQLAFDSTNGYWCLLDASATSVSYSSSYFYAKVFSTMDSGTRQNPWIWDNHTSDDRTITNAIDIKREGMNYNGAYYCFNLEAGVTYKFGIKTSISDVGNLMGTSIYLYDVSKSTSNNVAHGYYSEDVDGETWYGVLTYEPTVAGIFMIQITVEYYGSETGTVQVAASTAPEVYQAPSVEPADCSFTAKNGSGTLAISVVEVPEKQAANSWKGYEAFPIVENGVTHYEFAEVLTENLPWNDMAPQEGEIFSGDGAIKVAYIKGGEDFADNETAWKVNITTVDTEYRMCIAGGAGNIIDWGDGTTTTTIGANDNGEKDISDTNGRYSHTYSALGSYIIRVIGDTVHHIIAQVNSSWSCNGNFTLITEVYSASKTLTNCYAMFYRQEELTKVHDSFQIPQGTSSCRIMFSYTDKLAYMPTTLRLPNACCSFSEFLYASASTDILTTDITHWFDKLEFGSHWGVTAGSWKQTFQNRRGLKGTVPADKLWLDGSWGISSRQQTFLELTKLDNYSEIPSNWK